MDISIPAIIIIILSSVVSASAVNYFFISPQSVLPSEVSVFATLIVVARR